MEQFAWTTLALLGTSLFAMFGAFFYLGHKIDALATGLNGRIDGVNGRIDAMNGRMDAMNTRMDGVDRRLDGMSSRLDAISAQLQTHIDTHPKTA